ncbi:hypothetical protein GCM10023346_40840 [Arthrobacter gyeryongensis]|uniref:ABC transporter permease n=1 Tax=Arthrobacter gyeryongensis TaxID=1650592 RepID=A0ABP9SRM7_9MICC
MRDPATTLLGAGVVVFGVLIILGRNLYASFMLMLLRGIGNGNLATKGLSRILSVAMAVFGGVVIVIGIVVGAGSL